MTTPQPGAPPAVRRVHSDKARLEHFESRLRSLTGPIGQAPPPAAGRLQMIGLARVKARLGDDWTRLADKVHRLTKQILERRLSDEDVYVQMADRYVVLFATLTGVEATFKAQAIAREVTTLLIGELPEGDEAPLQITVHEIDPAEFGAGPTLESLAATMDHVAARQPNPIDDRPLACPSAATGPPQFDYLPIWSRRGKAIVGYACTCRQGDLAEGEDPYTLDCAALRTVLETLPEMERSGYAALVVAPLHWDTLVQLQRRQGYLELCRQMPQQLNRQLGFSISDVAPGAWRDLIRDRLLPLKPFARFFFVGVPPDPAQIRNLADIGIDALAFEVASGDAFDDGQRLRIEGFVHDATRHKLATCALGVDQRSIALTLLAAGVDFLGGDGVASRVRAPGAAYRLDLDR